MGDRRLKDWLDAYVKWVAPVTESPLTFIKWSGLYTLASVLKRKVKIGREYMGGWEIYPYLYIIFIAPPGKARKTTAADFAEELLVELPLLTTIVPTAVTKEKLINLLSDENNTEGAASVISSEFAMFIQKSGVDMYDVLTALFDGRKKFDSDTIGRDIDFATSPCINLLAATTPQWVTDNMPESVIGGGFASRVIFVYEEKARRYELYYTDEDSETRQKEKDDLIHDLAVIGETLEGNFTIEPEAMRWADNWYKKMQADFESSPEYNPKLDGYIQRKPAHLHKVAMLLSIAQGDSLTIELRHFKMALKFLNEVELKLPQTFATIGRNTAVGEMHRLKDFILAKGPVTKPKIYGAFIHSATTQEIDYWLENITQLNWGIKVSNDNGVVKYEAT